VASAINVIVHQERMRDGTRKITNVTEVSGMEGDVITTMDIFAFELAGYENGKVMGRLKATGLRPKFMNKIEAAGIHLSPTVFGVGTRQHN
jgi:pilus assembly protein CpaF